MRLLNVGGGSRSLPAEYDGYEQHLLDIDPITQPDIQADAKDMFGISHRYDVVYSSHCLEHFYRHEVPSVLFGCRNVLEPDGYLHLIVPDIGACFKAMEGKDIMDTWYHAGDQPITFHDVIYGWNLQVASGNVYYAHKTAFTGRSLHEALLMARFPRVEMGSDGFNLVARAYPCQ